METLYCFIPLAVIAAMGLSNDGQTVSKMVRTGDLLSDGQLTVDEYRALASAGVVFVEIPLVTFQSVEETAEGLLCQTPEPEPLVCSHIANRIYGTIPGALVWDSISMVMPLPYHYEDGALVVVTKSRHPAADALAEAGWARAVAIPSTEVEEYSDPFTYE
jgi:hypothetical protein